MAKKRRTEEPAGAPDDLENEARHDPSLVSRRDADEELPTGVPLDVDLEPQRNAEDELSESPEDLARRYLEEATEARARPRDRSERVQTPMTEQPLAIDERED